MRRGTGSSSRCIETSRRDIVSSSRDIAASSRDITSNPRSIKASLRDIVSKSWSIGSSPWGIRSNTRDIEASPRDIDPRLREDAGKDKGPFGDHLRRHLWALLQSERPRAVVAKLAKGGGCDDEGLFQRLLAAGLVEVETRSAARLRYALYRQYFSQHLDA